MGSRDFERATPNRIATTATAWGTGLTTLGFTVAVVSTQESATAGSFYTYGAITSGTAARQIGLGQNSADLLTLVVGTTEITFAGTTPTADNWCLSAVTKATGTVTPLGYRLDMTTGTWSGAITGSGTVANRTAGVCVANIGSFGAGDYWDGRIRRFAIFEKVLSAGEILELRYPGSWMRHMVTRNGLYCDLGWKQNLAIGFDEINPSISFAAAGTAPALDGVSPPGWL
jgi:hypothetical protein